jgi:diaminohydroxyphosphoribosylaminopyrimidine deaminase/5-amino-6-(5-phosphoribosylamino)uracil reductase
MVVDDTFYMQLALDAAWRYQGLTYPNPAVGALIRDKNGDILSIAAHKEAGSAHAELAACIEAVKSLGDREVEKLPTPQRQHAYLCERYAGTFKGASIYVTLEPCTHTGKTPPCSLLIAQLGFSRLIIGSRDPNPQVGDAVEQLSNKGIEVIAGVLEDRCNALLYPSLKWQAKKPFIFFKLAKHQNGTISGKHVSSKTSRRHVHMLRTKIDLLLIGGDTVRIDRPTLDTRLTKCEHAPDVMIYTSHDDIDRTIPLFCVPERAVTLTDTLHIPPHYRHIMIEGGEGMFAKTRHLVDYYLFFTTDRFREGKKIDLDANLKSLHSYNNGSDTIAWFKNLDKEHA